MKRLLHWIEPSGLASRRIMRELKLRDPEAWRFIVEDEAGLVTHPQTSGATTTVNLP